jgi:hypothetical protein
MVVSQPASEARRRGGLESARREPRGEAGYACAESTLPVPAEYECAAPRGP